MPVNYTLFSLKLADFYTLWEAKSPVESIPFTVAHTPRDYIGSLPRLGFHYMSN